MPSGLTSIETFLCSVPHQTNAQAVKITNARAVVPPENFIDQTVRLMTVRLMTDDYSYRFSGLWMTVIALSLLRYVCAAS